MNSDRIQERNKRKLISIIDDEVTNMFTQILNYTEVAVPNAKQHDVLRARILRFGNNCKRNLANTVKNNFDVTFIPKSEDVIEVNNSDSGKID